MERRVLGGGERVGVLAIDPGALAEGGEALLRRALEAGVDLFEVAPGAGEGLLAGALRGWAGPVRIASRVADAAGLGDALGRLLERLGRGPLDLALIDVEAAAELDGPLLEALVEERARGRLARIGASVGSPAVGLAALRCAAVDLVQVPLSLLDQRMLSGGVLLEAERLGRPLLGRSALLGGVLSGRRPLPERLGGASAVARAERWARRDGLGLAQGALRFCFSQQELAAVLVRIRDQAELDLALAAAQAAPLPRHRLSDAAPLGLEAASIDPSGWDEA